MLPRVYQALNHFSQKHKKLYHFREAEGGLAGPRVKFKAPGMQRSRPEEPGRPRAKESSTSCVLSVPRSVKKLTSATNREQCAPANKRNKVQVPEARQILGNVRNVKKTELITGPGLEYPWCFDKLMALGNRMNE